MREVGFRQRLNPTYCAGTVSGDDGVGVDVGLRLINPAQPEGPAVGSEDPREGELLQAERLAAGRLVAGRHRDLEPAV